MTLCLNIAIFIMRFCLNISLSIDSHRHVRSTNIVSVILGVKDLPRIVHLAEWITIMMKVEEEEEENNMPDGKWTAVVP